MSTPTSGRPDSGSSGASRPRTTSAATGTSAGTGGPASGGSPGGRQSASSSGAPSSSRPEGARPTGSSSATRGAASNAVPGQRRRARLVLSRIDPLTVAKVSLVLTTGLAIAFLVAIVLLWIVFSAAGVFDTVSRTVNDVAGSQIDAKALVSFPRVFGIALLLSVVQVVLLSALATLVSMIYNLAAYFVGGISVTLTEDS